MTRALLGMSFLGMVLAVAAIVRDDRHIAWLAMAVLAAALAGRLLARRRADRRRDNQDSPIA